MVATVTDFLKKDILDAIYADWQNVNVAAGDSDRFYLAIGRAEEWDSDANPPVPNSSKGETVRFQETIQSMKLIPAVSFVVPRHNWTAGAIYEAWDDNYGSNTEIGALGDIPNPYYVITDELNVYACVQQGKSANGVPKNSIYKPTDTTGAPFSTGDDNYVWRYLYTVGVIESRNFLTSGYMPVELILDSSEGGPAFDELSTTRRAQLEQQQAAVRGEVFGIAVDSGGTGYTSEPTLTITAVSTFGDSVTEAQAFARVANGKIYEVVMKSDSTASEFSFGANYHTASIAVTGGGGSGAALRAITTGEAGMGGNPIVNLNSSALMFNAKLTGEENGDFNVDNDFRQIGIVKNPLRDSAQYESFISKGEDSALTASTAQAYKRLPVGAGLTSANITGDQIATGGTSGAKAVVDFYDVNTTTLYVHQTMATGFLPFDSADLITVSQGGGSATVVAEAGKPVLRPAEVRNFSGEVIYIDNRSPVTRDDEQTEDIKVVIDL